MMFTRTGRLRSAACAATIALSLALSACGTGGGIPKASGPGDTAAAPNAEGKGAGVSLTMWHYWTDREPLMKELAAQYQAETGVEVRMELVPGDTLGQKFQAAAQAGTLPDISASWTTIGDAVAPYAKEGKILNLDDTSAKSWMQERFAESSMKNVSFAEGNQFGVDPGAYYVPIDVNNMQFLYNKDLFAQAGIEKPPATMDEFIEVSKKLREAGIQPFVSGFGSWGIDSMAVLYQWRWIGQAGMEDTFAGNARYDTQPWIESMELFTRLSDEKVFADGILGYDMPAAEALFASGKVAMIYDGSWAIATFALTNPDFKNYGVFMPPEWGEHPQYIAGGVGASAFVTGTSKNQEAALDFLKWLTEVPQQKKYAETSFNIPANNKAAVEISDPNIKAFSDAMEMVYPSSNHSMTGHVQTTMDKGLQDVVAGNTTAAEVAGKMQLAQDTGQPQ